MRPLVGDVDVDARDVAVERVAAIRHAVFHELEL